MSSLFLVTMLAWVGCGSSSDSSAPPAAVVSLDSPTAAPGQSVNVCVSMSGSQGKVAGIQMDLSWNASCLSADLSSGSTAKCTSNPDTGKSVSTAVTGSRLRALLFSILNMSPLPDAQLFCCGFTLANGPSDRCCAIGITNVRGSNALGKAITNVSASGGRVCTAPASASNSADLVVLAPRG